jgi:hypothetical protein
VKPTAMPGAERSWLLLPIADFSSTILLRNCG